MDDRLTLRILTPEGTAFEGTVEAVFLPGKESPFEVLPGHAAIISSLEPGALAWRTDGADTSMDVRAGAVMVKDNVVTVCAERG